MEDAENGISGENPAGEKGLASDGTCSTPSSTGPTHAEGEGQSPVAPAAGTVGSGEASANAPVSAKKVEANRNNAQKSTGPKTAAGKARSAANSYKHGFFAKHLFPTPEQAAKDKADYLEVANGVYAHYQPLGFLENFWTEKIATEIVRLARVLGYEQTVMATSTSPFWGTTMANVMRYQTNGNRLLNQAIEELERLQSKRKAEETATEQEEPAEGDTAVESDAPDEGPTPPEQD